VADRVEGLRRALELTPDNHALRLLLAESLVEEGAAEIGRASCRERV